MSGVTYDCEREFILSLALASFRKDVSSRGKIFRSQEQYFFFFFAVSCIIKLSFSLAAGITLKCE